jgi:hypothetical protein
VMFRDDELNKPSQRTDRIAMSRELEVSYGMSFA